MSQRKVSRRVVIDASVAKAAGGKDAVHSPSVGCRDFLIAVLKICHRAVLTAGIRKEWDDHQSRFARAWRVQMLSKKKLWDPALSSSKKLRGKIDRAGTRQRDRKAMLKDTHLIEAALATDSIVISLDEVSRALFDAATLTVNALGSITWVNPINPNERPIEWLETGAKVAKNRRLGQRPRWLL